MSTDQRFQELDQKVDRFNGLEALLLAKTLDQPQQQPTFSTIKVVPSHSPPANVIRSEPFIKPTDQPASQPTDRPSVSADQPSVAAATDHQPLNFSLTEPRSVNDQQPLIDLLLVLSNQLEVMSPVSRIQTV